MMMMIVVSCCGLLLLLLIMMLLLLLILLLTLTVDFIDAVFAVAVASNVVLADDRGFLRMLVMLLSFLIDEILVLMSLLCYRCLITGSFSCVSAGDGIHANPTDCSKFIQCHGGREYKMSCPAGLMFNPNAKICDWPRNVGCL